MNWIVFWWWWWICWWRGFRLLLLFSWLIVVLRLGLWQWVGRLLRCYWLLVFWWCILLGRVVNWLLRSIVFGYWLRWSRCLLLGPWWSICSWFWSFWQRFWRRFWCGSSFLLLLIFYLLGLLICLFRNIFWLRWLSWSWRMNNMNRWSAIRLINQYW